MFKKMSDETVFYIFYGTPGDETQLYAAEALSSRGWSYHKELKAWLQRVPGTAQQPKNDAWERGSYWIFDVNSWEKIRKDNFVLQYDLLEAARSNRS